MVRDAWMNCERGAAPNGETQARIKLLSRDAWMSCDSEAAFNGKTTARIKITKKKTLKIKDPRGAALNGKNLASIKILLQI